MRATLIHDSPFELDAGWLRRHFAAAGPPGETLYGDQGTDTGRAAARQPASVLVPIVERVKAITGGKGVPVVYDSVGKSTWEGSLDCLRPLGMWVSFGNASGPVPPLNTGILAQKGSLFLTRPTLMTYTASRADLETTSRALFDIVKSGKVKIEITARYKLADAAQCHRDLEGRKTTGSVILLP